MTDVIRRDPRYFLRSLKQMAHQTSWQKSMIFASRGRMIGYPMTLEHYNTILYSQSLWGRALEITKCIRSMQEDGIQPNGVTYYYICNGMANADHGYSYDFNVNHRLEDLQHWRVAINALMAAESNGFDATDTMYNSVICACTTPSIDQWAPALEVLKQLREQERKPHENMIKFLHNSLLRKSRPEEALNVLNYAAEEQVPGYTSHHANPFEARREHSRQLASQCVKTLSGETVQLTSDGKRLLHEVNAEDVPEYQLEKIGRQVRPGSGLVPEGMYDIFRPRVYRYLWYSWNSVANKYRPESILGKKQLAPKFSVNGIPGWWRA